MQNEDIKPPTPSGEESSDDIKAPEQGWKENELLEYTKEMCAIVNSHTEYDNKTVQDSLKYLGQLYFKYKDHRNKIVDKMIAENMPGITTCTCVMIAWVQILLFSTTPG